MTMMKQVKETDVSVPASDDWQNLGGNATGTASPISYSGTLWAFTRNTDQSVGYCNVGSQPTWSNIGGQIIGNPAVAPSPNASIAVVGLQQNGQIQVNYINPFNNTGTGWMNFAGGTPSGITWAITPAPVIAVNNDLRIEVFAIDNSGGMWHTFQTTVQTPIQWSNWSPLSNPSPFSTSAQNIVVFENLQTGALQVVALGLDNNIYMAIQSQSGGLDSWGAFAEVGMGDGIATSFSAGVGAAFSINAQTNVFGAYNSSEIQTQDGLVWCNPPEGTQSTWTTLNTTSTTSPVAGQIPSLVADSSGLIHMAWMSGGNEGQTYMISQVVDSKSFWQQAPVTLGSQNGNFTGAISGVEASGVQFFQIADTELYYITGSTD